jgi:hypothetical protein
MKKIAWLLVLATLLTCFVGCSGKKTELEKAFTTVAVDGGVKITQYSGSYTSLEIPSTIGKKKVVEIGDDVFANSYLLTNVEIPDTVKKIGDRAFRGCLALESIVLPDSVQEIGDYAFFGCWAVKTLEIGSGLKLMGTQAIQYCKSLEKITVDEDNHSFKASNDGVLFSADYKKLLCYPASAPMTSYTIPNNCTVIENYAFRNCSKLEEVVIGSHVTEIGDSAFYSCSALKKVELNANIDMLGYAVFSECASLEEIVLPASLKTIGYVVEEGECGSTFKGCSALRRVVLPAGLTNIYSHVFLECSSLAEIAFTGSESAWKSVVIGQGNDPLNTASVTFDYKAN